MYAWYLVFMNESKKKSINTKKGQIFSKQTRICRSIFILAYIHDLSMLFHGQVLLYTTHTFV